ncbi:hypothetical protein F441_18631 [Phytophthora nicotianae CJ01A1]|uniref:PH domain-containing protein n=3 Tax=Phytophthora nicotianae TaxID=4792 RepID=W2YCL9_PHYNI|nr:hypothetical protein L915_18250 [Phytophthora nicotianae]ETL28492.1 hypothetical protein L916_18157 [Phytophthora nicotianae]ETL81743.1 hypothetical protein L917_17972 [Phytophthora nicotianae]ETP04621.1 hypothetical protein F441_18631 [Phytophthora nicotianae CJ01A1]ETP32780.1 hypothetical protein F442_18591 [Phytophthora nicotianae P10297]
MENLQGDDFKLQKCPLVWRHVQLRLSLEQHWTKHHGVVVLSVTRSRRRPLSSDRVLIEQIPLDSSTRLVSPTSRDLRHLRFTLQHGGIRHRFQAPDEVAYEKWCVAIADAIGSAQEMEQELQATNNKRRQVDRVHADVYDRDATNHKLIQLHRPGAMGDKTQQGDSVAIDLSRPIDAHYDDSEPDEKVLVHRLPRKHNRFSQLSTTEEDFNHDSHADICIEKEDGSELDAATTRASDDEQESPKYYTEMWREWCQSSAFERPVKRWGRIRPLSTRETLRRRLMSDARKNSMLPYDSPEQPEDGLEGRVRLVWVTVE